LRYSAFLGESSLPVIPCIVDKLVFPGRKSFGKAKPYTSSPTTWCRRFSVITALPEKPNGRSSLMMTLR